MNVQLEIFDALHYAYSIKFKFTAATDRFLFICNFYQHKMCMLKHIFAWWIVLFTNHTTHYQEVKRKSLNRRVFMFIYRIYLLRCTFKVQRKFAFNCHFLLLNISTLVLGPFGNVIYYSKCVCVCPFILVILSSFHSLSLNVVFWVQELFTNLYQL